MATQKTDNDTDIVARIRGAGEDALQKIGEIGRAHV